MRFGAVVGLPLGLPQGLAILSASGFAFFVASVAAYAAAEQECSVCIQIKNWQISQEADKASS
jgi:hypothetical protein